MSQWPKIALGEAVTFLDSKRRPVKANDRVAGQYPYYGANGQQGTINGFLFDEPLVLLAEDGGHFEEPQRGIAYLISGKTWVNNHAHVLRANDGFIPDFIECQLKHRDIRAYITGTTRGKLTKSDASRILLSKPPIEEQRHIVDILDRATSIRRLRRRAQETARQIIPALFNKMFGDPFTNPMGWVVRPLSDVVGGFEGGRNLKADAETGADGVLRILKVSAVTSGTFRPTEAKPAPPNYMAPAHHFVRDGDLLISRANTVELVGATALVSNPPPKLLLPDKIWRILWRDPSPVTPNFLLAWFKQPSVRAAMSRLASGTSSSMRNISQGRLSTVNVVLPPMELQHRFSEQSALLERISTDLATGRVVDQMLTISLQSRLLC